MSLSDEYRYKIPKALEANPAISQRELARELGIRLGKVNYCIQALVGKGMAKARNYSSNKTDYIYVLTLKGGEDRAAVAVRFLREKIGEHEDLQREIHRLRIEVVGIDHLFARDLKVDGQLAELSGNSGGLQKLLSTAESAK